MEKELYMQASAFQQQAEELEQQLEFVSKQMEELEQFSTNLTVLIENKNKETISSIGKGVYMKTSLENKDLFVEVGAGVIVKKSPEETKKVILSQIAKFREIRVHITRQLEICHLNLQKIIQQVEKEEHNH